MIAASPAPAADYGGPEVGGILDEKQICVDVSTFLPVEWAQGQGEQCTTDFVQKCEERSENVCGEVTETICEVNIINQMALIQKTKWKRTLKNFL